MIKVANPKDDLFNMDKDELNMQPLVICIYDVHVGNNININLP